MTREKEREGAIGICERSIDEKSIFGKYESKNHIEIQEERREEGWCGKVGPTGKERDIHLRGPVKHF